MLEFWKVAVGIAGLGVVGAFVMWSLYKNWLRLPALNNRLTKKQVFTLFLAFLGLTFLFAVVCVFAWVYNGSKPATPITVVDKETLNKILQATTRPAQELAVAKDQQIAELTAALARARAQAEKGDAQAKAALEEARRSGDTAKLQAILVREADRMLLQGVTQDYLALCGEIAAVAYLRGDIDEAHFRVQTVLHAKPNDLPSMNMLGHIYRLRGQLDNAQRCYEQILKLSENDESWQAAAFGNLGLIYQTRGELDRAEEMLKKALAIQEKLGLQEYMANQYSNLGLVYRTRGELDRAEEMHKKALAIEEKLGRQEGMARNYGNLGPIYMARGELDRAEEMLKKALAIQEKLGRQEGMANQYSNLGLVYRERGELDRAEEMHKKSLAIEEKLGRQEGMARNYGNLGLIYSARGELDRAEEMHQKALAIDEQLGLLEGMAIQYGNLGALQELRGDLDGARELWTKSRDLFARVGIPHRVTQVQGWIDGLGNSGGQAIGTAGSAPADPPEASGRPIGSE